MKIFVASHLGLCFGVRDALNASRSVSAPGQTTIFGELAHNPLINNELRNAGFLQVSEIDRESLNIETPRVLVTAHGISNTQKTHLAARGHQLIDTTCPLVHRVHEAAQQLQRQGRHVIVIGRHGHVEVLGITGDLEHFTVVQDVDEVLHWPWVRLGAVAQSTTPPRHAQAVVEEVRRKNPNTDFRFIDTVCRPTRNRQKAVEELVGQIDALVVVGGRNSNNTRQLGLLAEERGVPWLQVEFPEELDAKWLRQFDRIGLTAGTSTPDESIERVRRALEQIAAQSRQGKITRAHASSAAAQ